MLRCAAACRITCVAAHFLPSWPRTQVPPNSKATTLIETGLVGESATITEGGKTLWSSGKYVAGIEGVFNAALVGAAVAIEHGSGSYAFQLA
jgi:hypothetical protein